jgi:hexosaminidase
VVSERPVPPVHCIVPAPVEFELVPAESFRLDRETRIIVDPGTQEGGAVAEELAAYLRVATGGDLPVAVAGGTEGPAIALSLSGSRELGPEGYGLDVDRRGVRLVAVTPAGLFRGIQTLRQMFFRAGPPAPPVISAVRVTDYPRFGWRGAMLDVARHFMPVEAVKRYVDLMALYKMNILHLHLTDDQGWRIFLDSWPRLADHGGRLQVGGTPGGYYTKPQYTEIVRYADAHYITVVPEIDTPGHTNAALASYPELNCTGEAPPPYTGTAAGIGSLCVDKEVTYRFLNDVVREISELTPGEYFHIGGDEASQISAEGYVRFLARAGQIPRAHGKKLLGWHEIARGDLPPDAVAQYWGNASSTDAADLARAAVEKGMKLVMSPSDRVYLDMKYDPSTPLGVNWAGFIDVRTSYEWDPATLVAGVEEEDVLGVEAALWTETIADIRDAEFMSFPRLPGVAEIGWSPSGRSWEEYRLRLATHGGPWAAMAVNFHRSPQVPWEEVAS